jgi:hypothetical protein
MHYARGDKGFQMTPCLRKSVKYRKCYDHKYTCHASTSMHYCILVYFRYEEAKYRPYQ